MGSGRRPTDREKGRPTGRTDLFGGGGRGGGAYRTLPYAAARSSGRTQATLRRSTQETGVSE